MNTSISLDDIKLILPNILVTVKGEETVSEKIKGYAYNSELWFYRTFMPESIVKSVDESGSVAHLIKTIIVAQAAHAAVPAIDIVLTPTGMGTVGTQNIVAASTARIERLRSSIIAARDQAITSLIPLLHSIDGWTATRHAKWFAASLFSELDALSPLLDEGDSVWDKFLKLRDEIIVAEEKIAELFISPELMHRLRNELISGDPSEEEYYVINTIRRAVVSKIKGERLPEHALTRVVNFIRLNPEQFEEWHSSATAKLYEPVVFQNQKNSGGYFF